MGYGVRPDHEHPPLPLKEVLSVPDASLDLVAPLVVGVVYVSPALQQHVGHEEHERAQLLILLHFPLLHPGDCARDMKSRWHR